MEKKRKFGQPDSADTRAGRRNTPKTSVDTDFDDWLERKLRTAYSSVLDEPIPDELIKLIDEKLKD